MQRAHVLRFAEQLRAGLAAPRASVVGDERGTFTVAAERYRDPARCARERAALFGGPRVVAASSQLAAGACLPVDLPGESLLLTRDPGGVARGFRNACRHRGTRLVDAPCAAKAITCPYHAWTYDLAGSLVHVPHAAAFADVELASRGLVERPVVERHGLIWSGGDLDGYLGDIAADVAALELDRCVVWKRARVQRRCNWKLVVEAFLDAYHIRVLHRDSVYRFFLDAASIAERVGPHIRALTGRRTLREAPAALETLATPELRLLATPSLLLFPATTVVEHPDFVSLMTVHPLAPDLTDWDHLMLVPADRAHEAEHWTKSWDLIEGGVFQSEDLWICEQAQRAIDAHATDELLFGSLELPARWFHGAIEERL